MKLKACMYSYHAICFIAKIASYSSDLSAENAPTVISKLWTFFCLKNTFWVPPCLDKLSVISIWPESHHIQEVIQIGEASFHLLYFIKIPKILQYKFVNAFIPQQNYFLIILIATIYYNLYCYNRSDS